MSEVDKMFYELGYIKCNESCLHKDAQIVYDTNSDKRIVFWKNKTITVYNIYDGVVDITMQELQAINKKVEELGWMIQK